MLLPDTHILDKPPQRIISLVPSQTELLASLGLEEKVVGITKFCVHPQKWFRTKTRIGGTKQLHLDRIRALQPDLIIANKEENTRDEVLALAKEFPVWVSEVATLTDAYQMISQVGKLTHRASTAEKLNQNIQQAFNTLPTFPTLRAAYFIWRKPYMVAGGDTFIQAMLTEAGFSNVFASQKRYPSITPTELTTHEPDVILLSSEPFPFREKHYVEFTKICPKAVISLVDGEAFSWYGSRLLTSPCYFLKLRNSILKHVKH